MSRARRKARAEAEARERRRAAFAVITVVGVIAVGFISLVDSPPAEVVGPVEAPAEIPAEIPDGRVRVEVLNVGGVRGMAREATGVARTAGFDVVEFGNRQPFDASRPSIVFDRVGRPDLAQAVADALGIDNVLSEPDPNLYVDVSVWLGSAWTDPATRSVGSEVAEDRAWWDPRGWLGR